MKLPFFSLILCLFLFSCDSGKGKPTDTTTNSKPKISTPKKNTPAQGAFQQKIALNNMGVGGAKGEAFWVTCAGHSASTIVFINNKPLSTTYDKNNVTVFIPAKLQTQGNFSIQLRDAVQRTESKIYNAIYDKAKGEVKLIKGETPKK